MKQANRCGATIALILGEDELAARQITLKDLTSGEQKQIPLENIITVPNLKEESFSTIAAAINLKQITHHNLD